MYTPLIPKIFQEPPSNKKNITKKCISPPKSSIPEKIPYFRPGTLEIRLGEHQLNTIDETLIVKDFNVDQIVKAASYDYPARSSNDIALVRLAEAADLTVYTPVCLPVDQQDFTGFLSTVAGWGATAENGVTAHILQELEGLEVVSDDQCKASIDSVSGYSRADVSQDMLCAGGNQGKVQQFSHNHGWMFF